MPSAVDTNVLVRFLVDDGSVHVEPARSIFLKGPVFLSLSVVLETEWVLRSSFGFQRAQICDAFDRILGLGSITVEAERTVEKAVDACRGGLDFADALHVNSATDCDVFYTFDRKLIRKAKQVVPTIVAREP